MTESAAVTGPAKRFKTTTDSSEIACSLLVHVCFEEQAGF